MTESSLPRVAIITVCWKSVAFLPALFEGLAVLDYPRERLEFHLVDNGPGDGSLDEAKRQIERLRERLPKVIIHEPGKNMGFAGGNNLVMRDAIERGIEYVYLLNHDAALEPEAIREMVFAVASDPKIGSVQSLLVLADKPDEVNSAGNAIHYIGFGYCNGYHQKRSEVPDVVTDIAYASGAGVLYPTSVLKEVGLFDETIWLYHEDLDLGWRILLAGYRNVLAPRSVSHHRYEFSRSISKWYWMERNRDAVILKNYRLGTILLLSPQIILADVGLTLFAIKGGWWREKLRAQMWFFKPSTWEYLWDGRQEIAKIRKVSDREILKRFTPFVSYQEFESPFVTFVMNPLWSLAFVVLKALVIW